MVVNKNNMDLDNPLSEQPFYVLLETHGSNDTHDKEKLDACLESAMEEGFVVDGESQGCVVLMSHSVVWY